MYHCVHWPCNIGKPLFHWIRDTITSLKDVYSNLDSDVLVMVWRNNSLLACLWKQKYVTMYLLELYSFFRVWLLEWLCSRIGRQYVGGLSDIRPQMKSSSFSVWSNRSVALHHLFISFYSSNLLHRCDCLKGVSLQQDAGRPSLSLMH